MPEKERKREEALAQLAEDFKNLAAKSSMLLADMPPIGSPVLGQTLYTIIQTIANQAPDARTIELERRLETTEKALFRVVQQLNAHVHDALGRAALPLPQ